MPNGNPVIMGHQEVLVNSESSELPVTKTIHQSEIKPGNSVS
ncbi:MAG: flagellar basal body L-ring protein FlgH [Rhodospirillales bacterium]